MAAPKPASVSNKPVKHIEIEKLQLDVRNPRFGESATGFPQQSDVVDWIVEQFGVDDVISSLAINDYFDAEPLIVERNNTTGAYIVKEGNRRLAASMILAKDPRAKTHWKKADQFLKRDLAKNWTPKKKLPVIEFFEGESQALLSYLGVRHIVSSQPWDSYAKATWISQVIESGTLTLEEISDVTGDKNRTIARLLEGFNFVKQLTSAGHFDPKSSTRKGRGSNVDYPFSWVYTLLGYGPVREWLTLGSTNDPTKPIPETKVDEAALALQTLFGDKNQKIAAAISDSRDISRLAIALGNPTKRSLLRSGYDVEQIELESKPPADRISDELLKARDSLRSANALLSEYDPGAKEAAALLITATSVRKQASEIYNNLKSVVEEEDDE